MLHVALKFEVRDKVTQKTDTVLTVKLLIR